MTRIIATAGPVSDATTISDREAYEPPMVEDVPIRADERLLAGCKITTTAGPGQFSCIIAPPCQGFNRS